MVQELKIRLRTIQYKFQLNRAFQQFQETGKTSTENYRKFRQMFVLTKGKYNDLLSEKISKEIGKETFRNSKGVLGNLSQAQIINIGAQLRENGYYVFDAVLSPEKIQAIYDFALCQPVNYLNVEKEGYSEDEVLFDEKAVLSPRYNFARETILNSPHLQNLIFDNSLREMAQEYLGCRPILDHLAFWWSAPFKGKGKSKAAQMYHFDMDRIKFIKFFFYLTDVTSETGPHCYVKGSHKVLPKQINRDGRYSDLEIESIYGKEKCIEITGKKGSILAVDTRGLHKGKELTEGKRLLFQIEFANSMFGQEYPYLDKNLVFQPHQQKAEDYTYNKIFK